jgi:hypothetical protein
MPPSPWAERPIFTLERVRPDEVAGEGTERYGRVMKLSDRISRWWKPAKWQDDHPLTDEEREQRGDLDIPDGYSEPQHGIGAESWDRIDVERDFRKP